MNRLGNNGNGPFPSDFNSLYKNGLAKRGVFKSFFPVCKTEGGPYNCPKEYVKEFGGSGPWPTQFKANFPVCQSEGGPYACPKEWVKEFGGLGDVVSGKLGCFAVGLVLGGVVGYILRHKEILVIPAL